MEVKMSNPLYLVVAGAARPSAPDLRSVLCAADYDVQMDEVVSLEDFDSEVDGQSVDMVLAAEADVDLNVLSTAATRCPVVVLGVDSEERAASLLQSGAEDCVPAANLARLPFVVKRCLRQARERQARQEADAARLHIEEQYREHVENANDVVFTIDLQGNFTYWNRAGEAISGYTRDEIHTLNMAQVLAPESLNIVAHMIRQKLADNRSTVYDLVMVAKSGEHIPLEVSTRLLFQDDAPCGVQGIARDVRERKRVEAEAVARAQRQMAVGELRQRALATSDVPALFEEAVDCVVCALEVEFCSIVEALPDGRGLIGRAGRGWDPELIGDGTVGPRFASQAGFTLVSDEPVIVDDMGAESRFWVPPVLVNHQVRSGASVRIDCPSSPFGVLAAFTSHSRVFSPDDIHFLSEVANILGTVIERARLETEREGHSLELATRVLYAQEEERKRISRELHDETSQALSTLMINLDMLGARIPEEDQVLREGFERMTILTQRTLDGVRALSHDLRPTILDDVGLTAALQWFAEECEHTHGVQIQVESDVLPGDALSLEVQLAIFRIAQEAMNNAGKHAGARTVEVLLSLRGNTARLVVEDDGAGFDPARVAGPTREGRLGLYGMAERASLLGGTFTLATAPGSGTRITLEVPLAESPLQWATLTPSGKAD